MNTVLESLREQYNYKLTENGGVAFKSTFNPVLDMFALCGAYRSRSDADCILMFKNAFEADKLLALKCLFYLADCRGGQGERRFFRICFRWLCENYPKVARKNLVNIPTYRRWDDVLYSCVGTQVEIDALELIKKQIVLDIECKTPSLLAKWLPSENASSATTKRMGGIVRLYLGLTHKEYRKLLSVLRSKINIVEKLMSENRWDEIEFDKIPSKAGLVYKNAFARRDIIAQKYEEFAKNENTKVNADTLYPYEIVEKAFAPSIKHNETDRIMIEKYWNNLPDYFNGDKSNMLCVIDTSGSMCGRGAASPINVAISLGIYAGERAGGAFKNHYISFSSYPQLIKIEGIDFVDKVYRIYQTNLCENTDLTAVFNLLLDTVINGQAKAEDLPNTIVVISDMEIDFMSDWCSKTIETEMDKIRRKWNKYGLELPRLVYWNVDARNNTILDKGDKVSFVSGMSPSIFESIITGKNGVELMLEKLLSERYESIML